MSGGWLDGAQVVGWRMGDVGMTRTLATKPPQCTYLLAQAG